MFVKRRGKIVEVGAGIHADGEITGIVMDDLVKAGHVKRNVVTRGRHADFEFAAMAAGGEGEFFECGEAHDFGDLFGGGWFDNSGRNDFVNSVL